MAVVVAIDLNADRTRNVVLNVARRLDDSARVMDNIGSTLVDLIHLTFRDSVDPYGQPWTPLSPVTIARRRKQSSKPLLDTGRLRNSISYAATRDEVRVFTGTEVIYAATQQFGARKGQYGRTKRGGPIPWGDIPARKFFPLLNDQAVLPDDWDAELVSLFDSYLGEVIADE